MRAGSLGYNNIGVEGGKALAAVLPQTQITSLECAAACTAQQLLMPINTSLCLCSLAYNDLTNDGEDMSGVLKLAEGLPQTKITTLKCAAASTPQQSVNAH